MVSARAVLVGTVVLALLAPAGVAGYAPSAGHAPGPSGGFASSGPSDGYAPDETAVSEWGASSVTGSASDVTGSTVYSSRARAPDTDNTVTRIAVRTDGDSRWTVTIRTGLETDEDVEEYRAFQERFRENESRFLDPFAERMGAIVAEASNETGREMTARNFTASTSVQEVPRRWGVVSFTFTWTNFAAHEGDALVVGDVFEGGFFLAGNDSLVVEAPPGYAVRSADPGPVETDEGAVTWVGREDFADRRPRVELVSAEPASPTGTQHPTAQGRSGDSGRLLFAAAAFAVVVSGLAALAARRLHLGFVPDDWRADGGAGTDGPSGSGGRTGSDGSSGAGGTTGTLTGSDVPVRTDAEKVEALLVDNDGRMKQADVADAMGWSASKTSRVVGDMVEEDRVEKLRVGRENVLDLSE